MEDEVTLPEDVLIEIFVSLRVKSLMRFRCVSKYWCNVIKSPTFVFRHLNCDCKEILLLKRSLLAQDIKGIQQGGDTILSFHNPDSPDSFLSPSLSIPFLNDMVGHQYVNLFGPCNGLICLEYLDIIILCNPALRQFKLLPPSPFASPEGYIDIISASGFGFDANTNSYKVLQMLKIIEKDADHPNEDPYIRIDLYNSCTNSWKLINFLGPGIRYHRGFYLFFNGACHWQANEFVDGPPPMGVILSFNTSTEVFHQFEFPDWFDDGKVPGLLVLNQSLAVVRYGGWMDDGPILTDIWVMKEYGVKESWTKELMIGPYLFACPFFCWKNEWILVESINNQLAFCALHANQTKKFQFYGNKDSFRAIVFTESLINLDQDLFFKQG